MARCTTCCSCGAENGGVPATTVATEAVEDEVEEAGQAAAETGGRQGEDVVLGAVLRVESCLNRLRVDVVTGTKGTSHPDTGSGALDRLRPSPPDGFLKSPPPPALTGVLLPPESSPPPPPPEAGLELDIFGFFSLFMLSSSSLLLLHVPFPPEVQSSPTTKDEMQFLCSFFSPSSPSSHGNLLFSLPIFFGGGNSRALLKKRAGIKRAERKKNGGSDKKSVSLLSFLFAPSKLLSAFDGINNRPLPPPPHFQHIVL